MRSRGRSQHMSVCDVLNSEFLARLESCQSDAVLIAQCFSEHSEGFSVYSDYCTNYPRYAGRAMSYSVTCMFQYLASYITL